MVAFTIAAPEPIDRPSDSRSRHREKTRQVRGLVGLKGSRYALLPVELRIENRGNGTGVAILRIVMIDARMAQIRWVGEVVSDPARTLSPALTASVATHFADLVLAP